MMFVEFLVVLSFLPSYIARSILILLWQEERKTARQATEATAARRMQTQRPKETLGC